MEQTARPRKVDIVILGGGILAATLALLLAERGKTVALLSGQSDPAALPLLESLQSFDKCYAVVGTRVRGISVIENSVLGVIAEDARYDSRVVVNLAEDERRAAYARMMRQPAPLFDGAPRILPLSVTGGWQLQGAPDPADISALAQAAADTLTA